MTERQRPGTSGIFRAIRENAAKLKRAVTGGDDVLDPGAEELGTQIAQAFVAGRFADVHALGTAAFQARMPSAMFAETWGNAVATRGPLTGFEVADAGKIDLHFIPGLEDTPQDGFVAFLEIAFSTPEIPLEMEGAFVLGAIILDDRGTRRLGALHAR